MINGSEDERGVAAEPETPHSHNFDAAIDAELGRHSQDAFRSGEWKSVKLFVQLRWSDNPGWVVDRYDAKFT